MSDLRNPVNPRLRDFRHGKGPLSPPRKGLVRLAVPVSTIPDVQEVLPAVRADPIGQGRIPPLEVGCPAPRFTRSHNHRLVHQRTRYRTRWCLRAPGVRECQYLARISRLGRLLKSADSNGQWQRGQSLMPIPCARSGSSASGRPPAQAPRASRRSRSMSSARRTGGGRTGP